MIKILVVVSLTAFLCCNGVESDKLSSQNLREQILSSGTVVFLDFLEKVRKVTEKIVRDDQFRKSRIAVQSWVKKLREFSKQESASGSQYKSDVIQRLFPFTAAATFGASIKEIFDKMFFPYINIYRQIFKNKKIVEIWKEVESYYLPGAPPIYSKPMGFFSFLLAKAGFMRFCDDYTVSTPDATVDVSHLEKVSVTNPFVIPVALCCATSSVDNTTDLNGFCCHLALCIAPFASSVDTVVVRSRLVNMLESGVDTVVDIGKIDFNQLHEAVQMVMDQIRSKAFEISVLERQKEKNDFLISLRTTSGLIVFYWDEVLKHTESPSFDAKFWDSMKQWAELVKLRNAGEKYHVLLLDLDSGIPLSWIKLNLDKFFDALALEYYSHGNEALGSDRFSQSNWAIGKSAVVYSLPVCKKLSEVGFGITEINRFLHSVDHITLILEGEDISRTDRESFLVIFYKGVLNYLSPVIEHEKTKNEDNQLLLPLRVIRKTFLKIWQFFVIIQHSISFLGGETELQQSVNEWNQVRSAVINELLKSEAFTRKELEEAPKNFIQAIHRIMEQLKEYTDLFDGFDGVIDQTALDFENSMHYTNRWIHKVWDMLVE